MAKHSAPTASAPAMTGQAGLNMPFGVPTSQPSNPVNQGSVTGQAVNPLGNIFAGLSNGMQSHSPANLPQLPFAFPSQPQAPQVQMAQPNPAPMTQDPQAQIQILQLLAAQGVPPEQWPSILQVLNAQNANAANGIPNSSQMMQWSGQNGAGSRDPNTRSPPGQHRDRDRRVRSRSPEVRGYRDLSPRRRRDNAIQDDRRGNDYRRRSPDRRRRSPSPSRTDQKLPPPGPKSIEFDPNLPRGSIKVLSRTLFVGGVTSSEAHLRSLFSVYGLVQTCIVNVDKRHAFVKMLTRKDAVAARSGMEEYKAGDTQLRVSFGVPDHFTLSLLILSQTKWGVGFGPRDCSDYQTGISIIPIERLTEADRKWMLTAEYGGTGGRAIEQNMVVEEPDIEIGAGVSSKGTFLCFRPNDFCPSLARNTESHSFSLQQ